MIDYIGGKYVAVRRIHDEDKFVPDPFGAIVSIRVLSRPEAISFDGDEWIELLQLMKAILAGSEMNG